MGPTRQRLNAWYLHTAGSHVGRPLDTLQDCYIDNISDVEIFVNEKSPEIKWRT